MGIYIFILIYVLFFIFIYIYKIIPKEIFFLFIWIALSLVLGLRAASVGEDTLSYLRMAESVRTISWQQIFSIFPRGKYFSNYSGSVEIGFALLAKIVITLFKHNQSFLIVISAITIYFFLSFINKNTTGRKNIAFAVFIDYLEIITSSIKK